jgi:hypothetical protein
MRINIVKGCDALETGRFCQMSRTMRIKKLTDSSALKPGELLVVVHGLNRCVYDALVDLRKSGSGVVQFYRHRQEPVPMEWPIEERQIVPAPENNE